MITLSRRAAIFTLAAASVVTAVLRRPSTEAGVQAAADLQPALLLLDVSLPAATLTELLPGHPAEPAALLEPDLVRQWRYGLHSRLRATAGGRAMALVRWDKAMLLAGLAREEGLRVRTSRINRSVFRIDIDV